MDFSTYYKTWQNISQRNDVVKKIMLNYIQVNYVINING